MRAEEGSLRVEVVTSAGPHSGAQVALYLRGPYEPSTGQPTWRLAGTGRTDEQGIVVLAARPARYLVSARAEGFASARAEVTRPRGESITSVRLVLSPAATLEGSTVERASRSPVPLAELTLVPRPSAIAGRASAPQEECHFASSNAQGDFRFEGLAPGEYQLEARAPGHAPKRLSRVHVPSKDVTVELEGSAFIEGFVELPDGKPAAQARVSAFGAEEAVTSEAGPGGGFSLDVPPGSYQVTARHGDKTGSANGRVVVGAGMTLKDVRIRLGAATSIAGVVRQKESGAPIADAAISVIASGDRGDLARATSSPDGQFEVGGLAPGAYDVLVQAQGFKALRRTGITLLEGQRFELVAELLSNGRIEGTVVDSAKKPIAGVQIIPQRRWGPLEGATATVSDATGSFSLEDLPPGEIYVAARRPGSDERTRVPVKVEAGKTAKVQVLLSDEGVLEGTVRLADGRVPSKPVSIWALRSGASRSESIELPATPAGTFSMRIAAGRYHLSAWLADSRWASEEQKIATVKAGQTERVELEVREGKKPVLITVLEPNGAPSVRAVVMGSEVGKSNIVLEDLTDESGQVLFYADSMGSDVLHLWATNGGRSGDLPRVPVASGNATLPLSPAGRLSGSVRSAGGRPVTGFKLVVSPIRTDEDYFMQQEFEFTGDRFIVEDIPPGRVAITATLPDGRAGKAEATSLSGAMAQADIVVEAGGSVIGRLLDAKTGEPIAQALVEVNGLTSPATGPDGWFRVSDVPPGSHRMTVWERQHDFVDKQVTVTAGKELDLGDWRLGPPRVEPGRLGLTFGMSGKDVIVSWITVGAETGELQVGDTVMAIDGATVLTAGEARQRELGAPGSLVTLSIRREGQAHTFTLRRAR
ncbi:MAG TPA: carboxypeptidase regulatory-like domain-containing protein [Hyalangium sp.]|nr:carboxypeptidase regulatory-like domain-containing protein [Hyalangium sp.]